MRTVTLACGALLALSPATASVLSAEKATVRQSGSPIARKSSRDWAHPLGNGDEVRHQVARPFERPADQYAPGHRGVDFVGASGQRVHAAAAGLVTFAGLVAGRGVVTITHQDGLRTTYLPIRPLVAKGQRVRRTQVIGRLRAGHPECRAPAGHTCLHWGLRTPDGYLEPPTFSDGLPLRLLPW